MIISKYSFVHYNSIMLKQRVVWDGSRWQYSDTVIQALIDLIEDVLVDRVGDFVSDKALPLIEPVRADKVPVGVTFSMIFVFIIHLDVQNHLFFNSATKFERIDLIAWHLVWPM